jgi:hypothetical protein
MDELIEDGAQALMAAFPTLREDFTDEWFRKAAAIVLGNKLSLREFVSDELIYLWGQLWDAYNQYLDGTWIGRPHARWDEPGASWSGRCEGLGERIKEATRLVGPVSWRNIPMTALPDGWFDWVNERLEISDPDLPDDEGIAQCRKYMEDQVKMTEWPR